METKKKSILVVDDEKSLARAFELKLTHAGFNAKAVNNGQEALAELRSGHYDAMLLDLVMPIMDGFQVLETLKKENISLPVMVTSNLSQEEDMKRAKALGAREYFIKSNTPIAEIVVQINKILSS